MNTLIATGANALPALSSDPSRFPPQPEFPYTNSGSPHNILSEIQHFYSPQHSWSSPLAISGPSRPSTSTVHPFAASPSTPSRGSSSASSSRASRAALEALMSTNHPSPARRGRRGLRTQLTREDSLEHQNKSTLTPAGSGTSTPANEAKSANDVPWRVPRYLASSNYSHCFATSPAASNVDASRSKILLPSKWDPLQKAELLTIADDGLQVTFKSRSVSSRPICN